MLVRLPLDRAEAGRLRVPCEVHDTRREDAVKNRCHNLFLGVLLFALGAWPLVAPAGPYTGLVVFGDSHGEEERKPHIGNRVENLR